MKKLLASMLLLLPLFCSAQKKSNTYDLISGTYTNKGSKGLYVYRFDATTGKISYLSEADSLSNPTFWCISHDGKFVYAGSESKPGAVYSFAFDAPSGKLTFINKQPAGASVVHVATDKRQKYVFAAAYSGGNATVLPINKNGSLGAPVQTLQDTGKGFNKSRQEAPHLHSTILSNDEKYLLTADLGTDKIGIYAYNPSKTPPLTLVDPPFEMVKPGNGPRHMTFSANGKYMYLVQEMGGAVNAYSFNKGKLTFLQSVNLFPDGFKGRSSGGDVHISPDGNYLYASNRGSANEIVAYAINRSDGQLTFAERYSTPRTPRSFLIDPAGNYLLVSCQDGNSIVEFKIDKATGKLTLTPEKIDINSPVCIKLVAAE